MKKLFLIGLMTYSGFAYGQATIGSNTLTGTQTAPAQYLGSSSNHDVIFKANNTERMRLQSSRCQYLLQGR
jgi:hypothetical protein